MDIKVESPFPIECLPRVWLWMRPFAHLVSDDFGPQTLEQFVSQMEESFSRGRSWAVYADGELGGLITFQGLTPWTGTAHLTLKLAFHRRGIAIPAARTVAAEIFAHEGVGKLVFYPLAGNRPIGALLINLGATREGTLKAQTLVNGQPTDMWIYGLTKEGFENATISHTVHPGDHRGGIIDSGVGSRGTSADHPDKQHVDADVLTGTTGSDVPTPELLDVVNRQPAG